MENLINNKMLYFTTLKLSEIMFLRRVNSNLEWFVSSISAFFGGFYQHEQTTTLSGTLFRRDADLEHGKVFSKYFHFFTYIFLKVAF